ncbi:MAG: hypothetical protein ACTS9Y_00435 [Methylophilus sp.]|uniref:hypothetical protein n=1 Tax=Methylophilus sp. TaxID=29541 RepID=UPI003F9F9A97
MNITLNDSLLGGLILVNFIGLLFMLGRSLVNDFIMRRHKLILIKRGYFLHRYEVDWENDESLGLSAKSVSESGIIITDRTGNVVGQLKRNKASEPVLRLSITE